MQNPEDKQQPENTERDESSILPNFRFRQWLLVALLCIALVLLLASKQTPSKKLEFESVSMVSAKADYYLESFTLMSAKPDGVADYTLSAETLIHLPTEELARVDNPSLRVNTRRNNNDSWQLNAATGLLPDHGQTIDLFGGVQLQQLTDGQTPLSLITPRLRLDRKNREINSVTGVNVTGLGWQLMADEMTGHIETGKLIFRENNHVQYSPPQPAEK